MAATHGKPSLATHYLPRPLAGHQLMPARHHHRQLFHISQACRGPQTNELKTTTCCCRGQRWRANLVLLVDYSIILNICLFIMLTNPAQCSQEAHLMQQQNYNANTNTNNALTAPAQPCLPVSSVAKSHQQQQYPYNQQQLHNNSTTEQELICPPVIVNKQNELVVGAGSNVTLACTARGAGPLTFVWFQDEKNLVDRSNSPTKYQDSNNNNNNSNNNNQSNSDPPPSTKLLEEKRYEIAEEIGPSNVTTSILYLMNLKLTDTSLFLCWVENPAGWALGNFSLIVNDSPPAHVGGCGGIDGSPLSSSSFSCGLMRLDTRTTQVAIVSVGFILLLAAAIVCLLMFRQVLASRQRSSKSSSQSDLKSQQANSKLENSSPTHHMFASSDEDAATEEDDEDDNDRALSVGSSASCRKTGKDLDDFIERMRSGIINMDYHTMSPVNQFNNPLKQQQQQQQQPKQQLGQQPQHLYQDYYQLPTHEVQLQPQQHQQNFQPLSHFNHHFPTLSNLSPSSGGSASTSFATNPNPTPSLMTNFIPLQQPQQFIAAANLASVVQSDDQMNRQYMVHQMSNYLPYPTQQHPYQYHG